MRDDPSAVKRLVQNISTSERTRLFRLLIESCNALGMTVERALEGPPLKLQRNLLVVEVAQLWGKSPRWVREHAAHCGGTKVGRDWVYPPARVREALTKLAEQPDLDVQLTGKRGRDRKK